MQNVVAATAKVDLVDDYNPFDNKTQSSQGTAVMNPSEEQTSTPASVPQVTTSDFQV